MNFYIKVSVQLLIPYDCLPWLENLCFLKIWKCRKHFWRSLRRAIVTLLSARLDCRELVKKGFLWSNPTKFLECTLTEQCIVLNSLQLAAQVEEATAEANKEKKLKLRSEQVTDFSYWKGCFWSQSKFGWRVRVRLWGLKRFGERECKGYLYAKIKVNKPPLIGDLLSYFGSCGNALDNS